MTQTKLLWQRGGTVAATLIMAGFGFTGLASADSISDTGPGSSNTISASMRTDFRDMNTNNIGLFNGNSQRAFTGSARVSGNTNGGDATTGNAMNGNSSSFSVAASNGGGSMTGSIDSGFGG